MATRLVRPEATRGYGFERSDPFRPPTPRDPSLPGTIPAAFALENPVANIHEYFSRPTFEPDPAFQWERAAERSPIFETNPDVFVGVRSQDEWNYTEMRLVRERKNRQALQEAGWKGVVAAIGAGALSPTLLLPAGQAAMATSVAGGFGRAAAWGAIAVTADETVLQLAQDERTAAESVLSIGTGAILAGGIGGAIRYMDPLAFERVASDMVAARPQQAIRPLESDAPAAPYQMQVPRSEDSRLEDDAQFLEELQTPSAATGGILRVANQRELRQVLGRPANTGLARLKEVARERGYNMIEIEGEGRSLELNPVLDDSIGALRNPDAEDEVAPRLTELTDPGRIVGSRSTAGKAATFGFGREGNIVGGLIGSPLTRTAMAEWPAARTAGALLSSTGIAFERNAEGFVAAPNGDIQSRLLHHYGNMARVIDEQRHIFSEYFSNVKGGSKFRQFFAFRDRSDFAKEIGRAHYMRIGGSKHPIEEVNKALDVYIERIFGPLLREAQELGIPGYADMNYQNAVNRAQMMIRRDVGLADRSRLRQLVRENTMQMLQSNPKVLKNRALRDAVGFDLDLEKYAEARARGQVINLNELADQITDKIMDSFLRQFQGRGVMHAAQVFRGEDLAPFIFIDPFKEFSNGAKFIDFLETDQEIIARNFVRKVGPDVEFFRDFGVTDPRRKESPELPLWEDLRKQVDASYEEAAKIEDPKKRREAELRIGRRLDRFQTDFDAMVGRLKHTWGLPDDPADFGFQAGRFLLNLNVARLMGGVTISSFPDLARPVIKYGLFNTFRDGYIPFLKNLRNLNASADEAVWSGAATDIISHARSMGQFDMVDDLSYGGPIQRGMQNMANRIGHISLAGFDYWTTWMKKISGGVVLSKVMKDMHDEVAGTATDGQKQFLRQMNLSEENVRKIMKLVRTKPGAGNEIAPGKWMPNTEAWGKTDDGQDMFDYETFTYRVDRTKQSELQEELDLQRVFRAALAGEINNVIITPGIERPLWLDGSTLGRLLGQFRSFSFSSNIKTLKAMQQDVVLNGSEAVPRILTGSAIAVALGMVSYYTWALAVGGDTRKRMLNELEKASEGDNEAILRFLDEGIARSGLLGALEDARRTMERVPGIGDYANLANAPTARSPYVEPVTDLLGPSAGLLTNDANALVRNAFEPNSEFFRTAKKLLPYQNVWWLRSTFDRANEALMRLNGINPG